MRGERSKAVRAVRNKHQEEDEEDSELSFSVAYEELEEEVPAECAAALNKRQKDDVDDVWGKPGTKAELPKKGRPYKVCGVRSKDRKGIVATSFKELVEKGNKRFCNYIHYLILTAKLKFADEESVDDLTLVLNDDMTEVDDEEYFQTLADNTVFVIVHPGGQGRGSARQRKCER